MTTPRFWIVLSLSAAAGMALLWLTTIPLGIPGEWVWDRIPYGDGAAVDLAWGWLAAVIVAVAYLGLALAGSSRLRRASRGEIAFWLFALWLAGFAWLLTVQESPRAEYRLSKSPIVLYYPGSSGYFYEARYDIENTYAFLATYEHRMQQGDVLHEGTHPPGLFILYRGLIRLCHEHPRFSELLNSTQPQSFTVAATIIAGNSRASSVEFLAADAAVLWLATLLTQALLAGTIFPLYLLIRGNSSRQAAWQAVAIWPLIPSLAVFLPKSDALYPAIAVAFLCCWLAACRKNSWCSAAAAGVILCCGMSLSLAFLPVVVLAVLLTIWKFYTSQTTDSPSSSPQSLAKLAGLIGTAGAAFALPLIAAWVWFDLNLVNVWICNLQNHAGFYSQYTRTYWLWLLVNPLELFLALGAPLAVTALAAILRTLTNSARRFQPQAAALWCAPFVWGLLWLSGKNMGEAARLWIILAPWAVWMAAQLLEQDLLSRGSLPPARQRNLWLLLLACQMVICVATVTRVDGFHLRGDQPFTPQSSQVSTTSHASTNSNLR